MEHSETYLLEESKTIGARIQWYLEQQEKFESTAILSSGAIWAFILSKPLDLTLESVGWIPAIICIILYIKSIIFTKTLAEAFEYLYRLEVLFGLPEKLGWVHYFRSNSVKYKRKWRNIFWLLVIIGNIVIRIFLPAFNIDLSIT